MHSNLMECNKAQNGSVRQDEGGKESATLGNLDA